MLGRFPYVVLDQESDAGDLARAYRQAQAEKRAGAVLKSRKMIDNSDN